MRDDIYIVEVFMDNEWIRYSYHCNQCKAVINAEVIHNSRNAPVRVIHEGQIVFNL